VLSLYSQDVLGHTPLVAGLIVIPQGVGGVLRGFVATPLVERVGFRWFVAGNWLLAGAGIAVLFRFSATSRYPLLGLVLLVIGFGAANVVFGGTVAGSTDVSNDEQGVAGALVNAARQLGAAIGVAVVASVVTLEADSPRGYRLVLMCFTGMAIVAAFLSLALPGRRPVAREPAPAPASHHST
jgi:predicted MFS family arabinose efflux permease